MTFKRINTFISEKAKIGSNVRIGNYVMIYDNVEIGDDTVICDFCRIGEPLPGFYSEKSYKNPTTRIGKESFLRSNSIIYCGNQIENEFKLGHFAIIRENNIIGQNCSIGNSSEIHGKSTIGHHTKIHSKVTICELAIIKDNVRIYPEVILANGIRPPHNILKAPEIGSYTIIAVNAVIMPTVIVGDHCLIGASSLVTKKVESYSVMIGNPAKYLKDIREIKPTKEIPYGYPWSDYL